MIRLDSGYRWPQDRADVIADMAEADPMPEPGDNRLRLIVGTFNDALIAEAVRDG